MRGSAEDNLALSRIARWATHGLLLAGLSPTPAHAGPSHPLLDEVARELDRVWAELQARAEKPHWMSIEVVDRLSLDVQATHGAAGPPLWDRSRMGDLDLRVGTPELDSTHKIRDASWFSEEQRAPLELPLHLDPPRGLRLALWRAADDAYRAGVRRLVQVRNNDAVKVAREDASPDFSAAPRAEALSPPGELSLDAGEWRDTLRSISAIFLEYPEVYDSNATLRATRDEVVFASSDGTRLVHGGIRLRVALWASTVAEDGMRIEAYDYVESASPAGLPDAQALEARARAVARQVVALRQAPLVEPYVGPAILRGRAAAVFFHEILGHRLEGHRQKDEDEGQTLTRKVGEAILPDFLSVYDDPTLVRVGETDLSGHYAWDAEGVAAERVVAVDRGVLRSFLLSRSPIEGFGRSNGHGRRQVGSAVVARQGNLVVQAHQTVSYAVLRARLLDEVRRQKKPFGLIFDDISGGFTFTGRSTPNAFQVSPVVVWRVYPDGRNDELVRGVDLIGTPLVAFSRIVAASDQVDVFNGVCGAESGWVPVSAVAPDLLLSEVEVQRKEKDNDRPPLLSPPGIVEPSR